VTSKNGSLPSPRYGPLDLSALSTLPIAERDHLVRRDDFARAIDPSSSVGDFIDSLPRILGAQRLRELAEAIAVARSRGKHVVLGLGGHVVKTGLGPLIGDLAERGVVTAIALNGAAAIHDLEIALVGETSEKVAETIKDGRFGMVNETGRIMNRVAREGARDEKGLGRALAEELARGDYPSRDASLVYRAARAGATITVHVSIGTDTVHAVPGVSGADIGAATHTDFRLFAAIVRDLDDGVFVNVGSMALMPEVFLKAVSVARNLGGRVANVTAANLDMIQHYRPRVNVLDRPVARGIEITGHHELLVPLLRIEALRRLAAKGGPASAYSPGATIRAEASS
jgi:hypothetical protein